jgi:predicted RNA-binding Zn ribbon-like protein
MNVERLEKHVETKAAPMPLLLVHAFVDTVDAEEGWDLLDTPENAARWLAETGLVKAGVKPTPAELKRARELRSALRSLIAAHSHGFQEEAATKGLRRLGTPTAPLRVTDSGHLELDLSPAEDLDALGEQVIGAAYESQIAGNWERLKICGASDCDWAFYDSSRNQSGAWCRMEGCGNREKNRAYRKRQRSA